MDIHIEPPPQLLAPISRTLKPTGETEALRRQRVRQEQRQQRLITIQQWQPKVESERRQCRAWLQQTNQEGKTTSTPSQRPEPPHPSDPLLGRQIRMLWKTTRPTEREHHSRKKIIKDLQRFFDETWPRRGLVVAPFGSSVTGMYDALSDVDVCVLDPSRPLGRGQPPDTMDQESLGTSSGHLPEWYDVRLIAKLMKKWAGPKWSRIIAIEAANVPIVKLQAGTLNVDVNINNRFGLINSNLIRTYAELRPELFRPLCYAVKHWLKRRGLNDPSGKGGLPSLSSYSIVLLIIQSLQVSGDLPNLQHPKLLEYLELRELHLWQAPKNVKRKVGQRAKPMPTTAAGLKTTERIEQRTATPEGLLQQTVPPPPRFEPSKYKVTFFDPSLRQPHITQVESEGTRKWINTQRHGLEWQDPFSSGLHLINSESKDVLQQERALEAAFKVFLSWYESLPKRKMYVSIAHGTPQPILGVSDVAASSSGSQETNAQQQTAMGPGGLPSLPATSEIQPSSSVIHGGMQAAAGNMTLLNVDAHASLHPVEWLSSRLVIQDPFISDRNTAKNIGKIMADRLDVEFARASSMLRRDSARLLFADLAIPLEYEEVMRIESDGNPSGKGQLDASLPSHLTKQHGVVSALPKVKATRDPASVAASPSILPLPSSMPDCSPSANLPPVLRLLAEASSILIKQGAEAKVYKCNLTPVPPTITRPASPSTALPTQVQMLIKYRFPKTYRHPSLTASLTAARTVAEVRALVRCNKAGVNVPQVRLVDEKAGIVGMEWIEGKSVREVLGGGDEGDEGLSQQQEGQSAPVEETSLSEEQQILLMSLVARQLALLHAADVIHGDLTTSNMMVRDSTRATQEALLASSQREVLLIDFGLSFTSPSAEDKAVDLYVLQRAFTSTHPHSTHLFEHILNVYGREVEEIWESGGWGMGGGLAGDARGNREGVGSGAGEARKKGGQAVVGGDSNSASTPAPLGSRSRENPWKEISRKLDEARMRGRKRSMVG